MADKKISQLTSASTPLAGTEVLPIVQSNATVKVSVANLTAGRDITAAKVSATDNIVMSTAGKGVDFSANAHAAGMTSELLNDYEEGTFTPTYVGSVTPGTPTYTTQLGRYVKIGAQVYITIQLAWSAHSGSSGSAVVGGLPYANGSVATPLSMVPFSLNATASNVQVCYVDAAASTILMRQYALAGTTTISAASVSNAGTLLISGSYTTT